MPLEDFLRAHPVPNGRPCSVCAFFRGKTAVWEEVLTARRREPSVSWERIMDYLRVDHGARFSWFTLRAHSINHEGVR